jgi:vitamin B12 transporter
MLKKILTLGASSLALLLPMLAHADGEDVVVTVTREALPVSKIGQAVDVLTDDDIKSYQSLSLSDLLARTTDLHTVANGGPGASGASSIRGSGADQVLYLLDGIALNDPSQVGGGVDLGVLSTGDAERIEVLRGPLSTLWGSGAVGGVVSITTRRAAKPLEGDLAVEGFDHYTSARLGVGGKAGRLNWRLFASGLNDHGVSAAASGSEADGFTQTQLSARASYTLTDAVTLTGLAARTHNYSEVDGYDASFNFTDTDETSLSDTTLAAIGLTAKSDAIEHALSISATETERNLYDPARTPTFEGRGRSLTADYHLVYRVSETTRILAGLRHQQDDMRTQSTWTPQQSADQRLSSIYGQVRHDFGATTVAISARHDESSSFGGQDIAQASVAVPVGNWRFRASAGQGVKVPSLYQLYSDYGNPALKPEKALTVDGGLDYSFAAGQISVTAFTRSIDNLIGFDACWPAVAALCVTHPFGFYDNIDKSEASGLEVEWTQDFGDRLHLRGNLTALNTRNESAGLEGKELARKPNLLGNVDLSYDVSPGLNLAIGLRHAGDAFDNAANTVKLDAYTVTDLRARYQLNDRVEVYARVENLTDQAFETAAGYGQPGRRLWIGARTRFF